MSTWGDEESLLEKNERSVTSGSSPAYQQEPRVPSWVRRSVILRFASVLVLFLYLWISQDRDRSGPYQTLGLRPFHVEKEPICPQETPLSPQLHGGLVSDLNKIYSSDEFEKKALTLLAGAVQIP